MKHDDADYHSGGKGFPDGPPERGATHIGMFIVWAIVSGLASQEQLQRAVAMAALQARTITPGQYCIQWCDQKLGDWDLNEEGKAFARDKYPGYLTLYRQVFDHYENVYEVEDDWEVFDTLVPDLNAELRLWRAARGAGQRQPWWRFW